MNPQQSYKSCPVCGQPAELSLMACSRCGHAYRTVFTPDPGQTVAMGAYTSSSSSESHRALEELERQYIQLIHLACVMIFILGIPTGGLGLLCLVYVGWRQHELRRQVTQLGIDANAWEKSLRGVLFNIAGTYFIVAGVVLLMVMWLTGNLIPH